MKKFLVLHYSDNWMMDGLSTRSFDTYVEAVKYLSEFQGKGHFHKHDKFEIVEVLKRDKAIEIDTVDGVSIYGFRV